MLDFSPDSGTCQSCDKATGTTYRQLITSIGTIVTDGLDFCEQQVHV